MSRILLVEDDAIVRESLSELLRSEGYDVTALERGEEVPELTARERFDVLITDLKLPGISGMDLIRKLTGKPFHSEIIIITGYGTMESVIDALQLGVYDYVNKPFDPSSILKTVRHAVERVELRYQKAEGEEIIRSLKEFNEEVLESSPEAIVCLDRDIVCQYWNSAAEKLSGIDREQVVGKNLMKKKVWLLGKGSPKQFQEVLNGNVAERTITVTSPGKKQFTLRQKLSPLRDSEGNVKGILAFLTDVSRSSTAETKKEALRRSRDADLKRITCLYNISLESGRAGTLGDFLESSLRFVIEALSHHDSPRAEISLDGKTCRHGAARRITGGFSAEINAGLFGLGELRVQTGESALSPGEKDLVASAAALIGDLVVARESSDYAADARVTAGIGRLAGGLAHNLNNILGGIVGYTSFMKNEVPDDSPIRGYIRTIEESSGMAADITGRLLDMSVTQRAGKHVMDINGCLEKLADLMRIFFDRNVVISTNLEHGLRNVEGDCYLLERVFINLCLNAREALQSGGRLTIATKNIRLDKSAGTESLGLKPGEFVQIDFTDTGSGMDEEAVRCCFDPFFSTKGLGYGLGLSSARGIVISHGGQIQARSARGNGTRIRLYLPAISRKRGRKTRTEASGEGRTVLVVDDEELIRNMVSDGLGRLGYAVLAARNGEEGLKAFRKRRRSIDAVVLDIVMPGMDYRDVHKEIREAGGGIGVILSSGYKLPAEAAALVEEGDLRFIQKPYTLQDLAELIAQTLEDVPKRTRKK